MRHRLKFILAVVTINALLRPSTFARELHWTSRPLVAQKRSSAVQKRSEPKMPVISKVKDADLEDRLFEYCCDKLSDPRDELEEFNKLPSGLQMVFSTMVFEDEAENGGFHQFFWNSDGVYAADAVDGLRMIGAEFDARLLEKAIAIFEREVPRFAKLHRLSDWKHAYLKSESMSKLPSLDTPFYEHGDDLSKLRIKYIRSHPKEFGP